MDAAVQQDGNLTNIVDAKMSSRWRPYLIKSAWWTYTPGMTCFGRELNLGRVLELYVPGIEPTKTTRSHGWMIDYPQLTEKT